MEFILFLLYGRADFTEPEIEAHSLSLRDSWSCQSWQERLKIQYITAHSACKSQERSCFRHLYSKSGDRVLVSVSASSWKADTLCRCSEDRKHWEFVRRCLAWDNTIVRAGQRPLPALGAPGLASGGLDAGQAGLWALQGGRLALRPHLTSQRKSGHSSRLYDFFFTSPSFFFSPPPPPSFWWRSHWALRELFKVASNDELNDRISQKVILRYSKMHVTLLSFFKQWPFTVAIMPNKRFISGGKFPNLFVAHPL